MSNMERRMNAGNGHTQSDSAMVENETIKLNFVRNKLENFQNGIIKEVEHRMSGMIDEVMQEIRQHELRSHEFRNFSKSHNQAHNSNTWNNRIAAEDSVNTKAQNDWDELDEQSGMSTANVKANNANKKHKPRHEQQQQRPKLRALPDKIFVMRESYLTALLEVNHMKSIYHIFYIILIIFLLNSVCYDYFVEGRVNFGLGTFKKGLSKIHYVLGIWLLEHVFVFMLYYAFTGWAAIRQKLQTQSALQRFWSHSCLITYISSQLVFGYAASHLCLVLNLPFVTASVLLLETTRLLMKMHSFVRTNVPRVLAGKLKSFDDNGDDGYDQQQKLSNTVPAFGRYLYFLFAPTLIYRDNYPRNAHIRRKFALARFLEVVAVAFLYSYIQERHIAVHFYNYGREEWSEYSLIVKLFGMLMPGIIIFLCGFYLILHSWLNFTGELLRFGDRMFYKDWWTSTNYDAYYRNWNVVVHDWLYEFIYKDFYKYVFKGSKLGASLMVFLVSALVHEHIIGFALQLFFPVMFVFFAVIGVIFIFITRLLPNNLGNVAVWFSLIIGNGVMISLYAMEYYARFNCPKTYNSWTDYLIPAVCNCYKN